MSDFDDLDLELGPLTSRPASSGPVVLIRREALEAVLDHSAQDTNTELGGVLLGQASSSAEGTLVLVQAAIPALHTQAARAHVTFTHDTWEQVNAVRDREHPDMRIVGWYHTHPGFGLFLSEHDLFIHRNFFNEPWQVAQVLDPRTGQWGFFVWEGGDIRGPYGAEVVGAAAPAPTSARPYEVAAPDPGKPRGVSWWHWATLLAAILIAGWIARPPTSRPLQQPAGTQRGQRLAAIEAKIDALDRKVTQLGKASALETAPAKPSPVPADEMPEEYTVLPGDSLWRIAQVKYGDGEKWRIIARFNNIAPSDLEPGMVILVPRLAEDGGSVR
ncbi:MAG: LysM peptidoglycan-binding domain-containing protein [Armatimonadetes bacterium]|nr:LysM peptidoglycan-binding domain-containing protein [Armatimonadota bacterium]